jgi:tetratricopeptide (TPR) repeat protein
MVLSHSSQLRPRLSVAMIVRNEEETLPDSIASVRSVADEIVVLDTGSTDQTVAVARRLGVTVANMPWGDSFSAARNCCLGLVGGDWVLWLDAGEQLNGQSAAELRRFIDHEANPRKAYALLVEASPLDPAASAEQVARTRLVPNRPALRFEGRVRESLEPSLKAAGLTIATSPGRILCHPRQHDPALKVIKAKRDLALATKEIAEKGESARLLLAMGEAYSHLGSPEQARGTFRRAIEAAQHGSTDMLEAYYGLLTAFDGNPYLQDLQLSICVEALEIFPLDAQLLLAMASYMHHRQRNDLAIGAYRTAVEHGQIDSFAWHLRELPEVAVVCLSLTLQMENDDDEARRVLEEALERHTSSRRLLRRLLDLLVKLGCCDEALALTDRLAPVSDQRGPWSDAVRGACKAVENDWPAALGYLQNAHLAGCRDPFCLRWLAVTLFSSGQIEAARPVFHEWQRIEPTHAELRAYLKALEDGATMPPAGQKSTCESQSLNTPPTRIVRIDHGLRLPSAIPTDLPVSHGSDVPA